MPSEAKNRTRRFTIPRTTVLILVAVMSGRCDKDEPPASDREQSPSAGKGLDHDADDPNAQLSRPAFRTSDVIPVGRIEVDVMEVALPKRAVELGERLRASVAQDDSWLREHIAANARPGKVLPYHPKMGLTKSEYEEMLELSAQREARKTGTAVVGIESTAPEAIRLDGGDTLPALTGIVVNFASMKIETRLGFCEEYEILEPTADRVIAGLGQYECCEWKCEIGDDDRTNMESTSLMLGRLTRSGRGFLYYKTERIENKAKTFDSRVVITFEYGGGS